MNFSEILPATAIPMEQKLFNIDEDEMKEKNNKNISAMTDILKTERNIALVVEHNEIVKIASSNEVSRRTKGLKRKEEEKERRRLKKTINLFEVSCKVMESYCELGTIESPC